MRRLLVALIVCVFGFSIAGFAQECSCPALLAVQVYPCNRDNPGCNTAIYWRYCSTSSIYLTNCMNCFETMTLSCCGKNWGMAQNWGLCHIMQLSVPRLRLTQGERLIATRVFARTCAGRYNLIAAER